MILVDELTVKLAALLPSFTDVAPVKLVPVIVTFVPGKPWVGVKPLIVGFGETVVTVKLAELVPVPFAVGDGDRAGRRAARDVPLMLVLELTVKLVAAVPLNVTAVAPVKFVPVIADAGAAGPPSARTTSRWADSRRRP